MTIPSVQTSKPSSLWTRMISLASRNDITTLATVNERAIIALEIPCYLNILSNGWERIKILVFMRVPPPSQKILVENSENLNYMRIQLRKRIRNFPYRYIKFYDTLIKIFLCNNLPSGMYKCRFFIFNERKKKAKDSSLASAFISYIS